MRVAGMYFWEEDMSVICLGLDVITLGLNVCCLWKTDEIKGIWKRLKNSCEGNTILHYLNYWTFILISEFSANDLLIPKST